MSAPVLLGCAAAVVCAGMAAIGASQGLVVHARTAAAADAAALAAADAASGWAPGDPCGLAAEIAQSNGTDVVACRTNLPELRAEVELHAGWPFAFITARARAGVPGLVAEILDRGRNAGWVWPSDVRAITQDHHDGYAIDLAVGADGALRSPAAGVVVSVGLDPGGVPGPCVEHPDWWHGPNYSVLIRHVANGRAVFSSHNHIEPGSPEALGIAPGVRVRAGQQVARAGMSGCTSGPHSHFTIASGPRNTNPDIDPFTLLGRP